MLLVDPPNTCTSTWHTWGLSKHPESNAICGCTCSGVMWSRGPQDTTTPQSSTAPTRWHLPLENLKKKQKIIQKAGNMMAGACPAGRAQGASGGTLKNPGDFRVNDTLVGRVASDTKWETSAVATSPQLKPREVSSTWWLQLRPGGARALPGSRARLGPGRHRAGAGHCGG